MNGTGEDGGRDAAHEPRDDERQPDGGEPPAGGDDGEADKGRAVDPAEVRGHEEALPHRDELDFEPDVEYLHRAIYREAFEPAEGREHAPWWVWTLSVLAIFWGGWYLGRHGGTFDATPHLAYSHVQGLVRKEVREQAATTLADPVQAGRALYTSRCQLCHQPTGEGLPGVFPPLIDNETVTGPPTPLVLIILHGLSGPLTVAGQMYNGAMPAWEDIMSDAEIAAVVTFIRQWETNQAPPVSPELVTALRAASVERKTPWTIPELEAELQKPEIQEAGRSGEGAEQAAPTAPAAPAAQTTGARP
jgi:mono/diheme cytochrome c family protein